MIVLNEVEALGLGLALLCIGLIVGAGLGYWTAAKDHVEVVRKASEDAWNRGARAMRNPYSWGDKNPYSKEEEN